MRIRKYIFAALLGALCLSAAAQSRRDIVLRKATLLRRMYCFDEAAEALASLLRPGVMDLEVLGELADCHFQASRFDEARQLYFILSQQRPEDLGYQVRYMYLLSRTKAYSSVIAQGRELLKRDTLLQALTLVGDAFNNMEQADSAMRYYNAALLRQPHNASVVSKMANILLGRKDYDGVLTLSDNYLAMDSLNIDILRIKGLAHYLKGEYKPSAASFETVIEEGDESYAPHYYLAKDLYNLHLYKDADEHFMKAWQLDSTRASLALEIAENRTHGPYRYESEVKPWFEKALAMMEPDHDLLSSIYQSYATMEYSRQNWDLAISLYKVAYEFNPKYISALSTIGYCYEQKKDYKNAAEYYERYLEYGRPGSNAYKFVEESLRFVRAELFMEEH